MFFQNRVTAKGSGVRAVTNRLQIQQVRGQNAKAYDGDTMIDDNDFWIARLSSARGADSCKPL